MQEGNFFDIKFKNGVMRISPLTIEDRTESFFRNLIAYEQYSDNTQFKLVTDYVKVMDYLINSPKDVELLCRHGIIDNWLGDAEAVFAIFNKITDSSLSKRIRKGPWTPEAFYKRVPLVNSPNLTCKTGERRE
ncbi:hypothetical protein LguiB_013350 [Lonicera macranthoides]